MHYSYKMNAIENIINRAAVPLMDTSAITIPVSWIAEFDIDYSNFLPTSEMRTGMVHNSNQLTRSIAVFGSSGIDMNWLWDRRYNERYFNYISNYFFHPLYHVDVDNLSNFRFHELVNTRRRIAEIHHAMASNNNEEKELE